MGQSAGRQSRVGDDAVVLGRAAHVPAVDRVGEFGGQVLRPDRRVENGLTCLFGAQAAPQVESGRALLVEQTQAFVGAAVGLGGLSADEGGSEDHLPADDEAVLEVVTPELPSPRLRN